MKVGKTIFKNTILGHLKDKTVLFTSHNLQFAKEADQVIVMENGKIGLQGKIEEIENSEIYQKYIELMEQVNIEVKK